MNMDDLQNIKLVTLPDLYFVEWSEDQQRIHIGKADKLLMKNYHHYLEAVNLDFKPLCIVQSMEDGFKVADAIMKRRTHEAHEGREKNGT